MKTFVRSRGQVFAIVAVLAGSVAPMSAIDIDRNGNAHVTLQDMQDASNAQSRADAANWQQRINDNNAFQARMAESMDKWKREVAEREAYNSPAARAARYRAAVEAAEREESARASRAAEAAAHQKFLNEIAQSNWDINVRFQRVSNYIESLKVQAAAGNVIAARRLLLDIPAYDGFNGSMQNEFGVWVDRRLSLRDLPEKILTMLAKTDSQAEIWRLAWLNLHASDLLPENQRLASTPGPQCNDANLLLLAHELDRHEMLLEPGSGAWVGRRCMLPEARRQLLMEVLTFEIHRSSCATDFILNQGVVTFIGEDTHEPRTTAESITQHYARLKKLEQVAPGAFAGSADYAKIYTAGLQAGWQAFRERGGIPRAGEDGADLPIVRFPVDGPVDDDFYLLDPAVASVLLDRMRRSNNLGLAEYTARHATNIAGSRSSENPARTVSGLERLMDLPDNKFQRQTGDRALLSSHYYGNTIPGGKDGLHRILPGLIPQFTTLFTTPPSALEAWLRGVANQPRLRAGDASELTTFRDLALAIAGEAAKPAEREKLARLVRETFDPIEAWHAHVLREKNREAGNLLLFKLAAAGNHLTDTFVLAAIDDLSAELAAPIAVLDEVAHQRLATRMKWIKQEIATPGMRPILATALLGAAVRVHAALEQRLNATGTVQEYEFSLQPFPPSERVGEFAMIILRDCPDVAPKLRAGAAAIAIDCNKNYSDKIGLLTWLDTLVTGEADPLADPVALLAAGVYSDIDEEIAIVRRSLLRVAKSPRGSLLYALPWESLPSVGARNGTPPPAATLAAITAFEKTAVGSRPRANAANALVALQLKADLANPLERSAEKALFTAACASTDDGVAAFAYATLRRRQHAEIPWAYPPPARRDAGAKGAFSVREPQTYTLTRIREANGFAALVLAFRKNVPDARPRLLELYDPTLGPDTRFALGADNIDFADLGTRARLAAVGTTDATVWLQRITALPAEGDHAALAAAYVAAVRAHANPASITADLLRMERDRSAGFAVHSALRTLIADADAPRFFGSAWRDDSPGPFQTAWMLEILDQQAAQELPVPEDDFSRPLEAEAKKLTASVPEGTDVPEEVMGKLNAISDELGNHRVAYQEQKMRERMRSLSPKTSLLLAFASASTTSELARAIVAAAPSGFLDNLAKFAAEEDPSLKPLYLRYSGGQSAHKPITAEHWAQLAEGRLWSLPDGVREAD